VHASWQKETTAAACHPERLVYQKGVHRLHAATMQLVVVRVAARCQVGCCEAPTQLQPSGSLALPQNTHLFVQSQPLGACLASFLVLVVVLE
jgi:hypothetical protein